MFVFSLLEELDSFIPYNTYNGFIMHYLFLQILRKLEEREADLDRLVEMEEKDIGSLIRYHPGGKVTVCFIL